MSRMSTHILNERAMVMANCGTCHGMMTLDRLDGGTVCLSCGRRTPPPPAPQR